RVY
ncbi:hypothetical protein ACTFIZ_007898, partial [Dictyostelium cf. discoideum]